MGILRLDFERGQVRQLFREELSQLSDPTEALDAIGFEMVQRTIRGFDEQGRGDEKWPPRSVPNVAAIARVISEGKNIRDRYYIPRPALIDNSTLKNSWKHVVQGKTVVIGTTLPYAVIHQEGLQSVVKSRVPDLVRSGNKKAIRELAKLEKRGFKKEAKRLRKAKEIKVRVPRRVMLQFTEEDVEMAANVLAEFIAGEE